MLARLLLPISRVVGKLRQTPDVETLDSYRTRRAGDIIKRAIPGPRAKSYTQEQIMDIHKLTGQKHSEDGQTPGDFLKVDTPTTFSFQPHGLTAADVGAAPSSQVDPALATLLGGALIAAEHYHSALAAADLSPNPGLSLDASNVATLKSANAAQSLSLSHDASNAYVKPSTGAVLIVQQATDSPMILFLRGKGTGNASYAQLRVDDRDTNMAYATLDCYAGHMQLAVAGTGAASVRIQNSGSVNVNLFGGAASGKTAALTISGYRTADQLRALSIAVGSVAADQADFSGLSTYRFSGSLNATANLQTGGTTRIDSGGAATLGNITSATHNVPRFRGSGTSIPATDLRAGDLYLYTHSPTYLMLYDGSGWYQWEATPP
jgi:hypothetical protein